MRTEGSSTRQAMERLGSRRARRRAVLVPPDWRRTHAERKALRPALPSWRQPRSEAWIADTHREARARQSFDQEPVTGRVAACWRSQVWRATLRWRIAARRRA